MLKHARPKRKLQRSYPRRHIEAVYDHYYQTTEIIVRPSSLVNHRSTVDDDDIVHGYDDRFTNHYHVARGQLTHPDVGRI